MVVALDTSSAAIATSAGFTVSVAAAAKAVEVMARDPVVEMVVVNAVVTASNATAAFTRKLRLSGVQNPQP